MHILIATNAFKNSLNATAAAGAIEKGLQRSRLNCTTIKFPVADGGDGTVALLMQYLDAAPVEVMVQNPYFGKLTGINAPGTTLEEAVKNTISNLEKAAYHLGQ